MASRRRSILEEALARLQAIQTADGFNTNAGQAVSLNEVPELGEDDPDVIVALLMGDDEPKQQGLKIFVDLPIEIQAVAKIAKPATPGEPWHPWIAAEDVLEDIKRAFELDDMTFGGLLNCEMDRGTTSTAERQPGSTTVGLSIGYRLRYSEKWGAPEA